MKIRIKFAKTGPVKFVGHLDMLRFFQKLIRRAGIDICYSEGFNPHQKMSFAAPLGVGMPGCGEYVDIEVHTTPTSAEALKRLNEVTVEGISLLSYRLLPDDAPNAMSCVSAADYFVCYREGYEPDFDWKKEFSSFMEQSVIEIEKETKKSTAIVDIRPMIYTYEMAENGVKFKLATGSANNLKPELVFAAFYQYLNRELPPFALDIMRCEVYADAENKNNSAYLPLEDFGTDIL